MAQLGAKVRVYGDWDGSALKGAEKDLGAFGGKLNNMLGPALLGAAAAAGALAIKLGVDGVKAAVEDQAASERLAQTLNNLGLAHDTGRIEDYISQLERSLGIADTELRPAYDRLVRSIGNTEEANRALKLSLDISAGSGKSLEQVVEALGKAYNGQIVGLSRLGAGLDAATLRTGDMNLITQQLSRTFEGQAATSAKTVEGQMARVTTALDNVKEAFGLGLISAIGKSDNATQNFVDSLENLEPTLNRIGYRLGLMADGALILANNLELIDDPTEDAETQTQSFGDTLRGMFGNIQVGLPFLRALEGALVVTSLSAESASYAADTARDSFVNMMAAAAASGEVARAQSAQGAASERLTAQAKALGAEIGWGNLGLQKYKVYLEELRAQAEKTKGGVSGAGGAIKDTTDALTKLQQQFGKPLAERANALLEELKDKAKAARDEMVQFYNSIKDNVNSTFSLSAALDSAKTAASNYEATQRSLADATRGLADAQDAEAEARKRHDEVMADSDASASQRESVQKALADAVDKTAEATKKLTTAQQDDAKAADEHGKTYIQRLQEQAGAAQQFLQTVTTLYEMGLRGEALRQIGEMSATAGITAGTELINGGEAAITETMRLVDATNGAAAKIAELTTAGFIGTGVITANNTVTGFADVMGDEGTGRKKLMRIMDRLAADMRRETTITVTTIHENIYRTVGQPPSGGTTILGATGGIVNRPTFALIGEAGPEAVIPLDRSPGNSPLGAIGGSGTTINLTVNAGMGTNGAEVGRQIVDALKQYERRNGAVYVSA